jgi:pyruvate dehydrogenase E2 component (dihydrolipoamide acetyltransferase)
MAIEVRLPRLGQGMERGTIVKWLKAEGEHVEKGEPLFEVDTDKATQEVEADASGVLLRIAVASGEVPVGETLAFIGEPGEAAAAAAPEAPTAKPPASARPVAAAPDFRSAITHARGDRVKASPLARRKAREDGIDLAELTGTGPDGRIIAEDVERAGGPDGRETAASAPVGVPAPPLSDSAPPPGQAEPERAALEPEPPGAAAREPEPAKAGAATTGAATTIGPPTTGSAATGPGTEEPSSLPLSSIRRTIARRLSAAWQLPVFQLTVSVEMTHANALVARSRELNPDVRVTVTDLMAKVCARALIRHPELNVQFTDHALLQFATANIGIAVAAPQGLVVPVIPTVERLSLTEVAGQRASLVARAREARLSAADLEGGTFTISNLGMFGVEQFIAVLNPPQAAILAVGATVERPIARAGEVVIAPMMTMTLTVDHRAVDGGPAAEFLQTLKTFLEDPALAL